MASERGVRGQHQRNTSVNITLINVQISEGNNIVPPLGVLYIAAVLEYLGHSVQVFDIDPDVQPCLNEVEAFSPAIIGLSCYTNTYDKARRLHAELKGALPHVLYICGGVHATAKPLETFNELGVDYLVYAEGERTVAQLVAALESGNLAALHDIRGLYYRHEGKIRYNGPPDLIDDLDTVPHPARHLLDFEPYLVPPGMIRGYAMERITTIFTSRGCPYACTYCASHIVQGKRVRRRSPANVVAELEDLVAHYAISGFYICDDVVTLDRDWTMEFSQLLEKRQLNLRWACQSRVDSLDDTMLKGMKRAGLVQIDFGVESGSDSTLKTMRKAATANDARNAFTLTRANGIRSCATFILGFQNERREDMEETFALAKEIRADYTAFYFLTPYPGTPIYDMAIANNWFDPALAQSEQYTHRQIDRPLMSVELPAQDLVALRRRFQNFFFLRNYFHWYNLRFYLSLLKVMLCSPRDTLRCFRHLAKSLRLDSFVESVFEMHQRRHRLHALRHRRAHSSNAIAGLASGRRGT